MQVPNPCFAFGKCFVAPLWASSVDMSLALRFLPNSDCDGPNTTDRAVHWILRIGTALCFIGHGAFGFIGKESWIEFFALVGIGREWGYRFMPIVGSVDILTGVLILLRPRKILLWYMVIWALWTAALRPLSGSGVSEFLERAGNYGMPLALLLISPGGLKSGPWISGFGPIRLRSSEIWSLATLLQVMAGLLLIGHGSYIIFDQKQELTHHWYSMGVFSSLSDAGRFAWTAGNFEILLGAVILINPVRTLVLIALFWKVLTELLYPISGDYWFEFIERFGSYSAPLALLLVVRLMPSKRLENFWPIYLLRKIPVALNTKTERSFLYGAIIVLLMTFSAGRELTSGSTRHDASPGIVNPAAASLIAGDALVARLQAGGLTLYFRHFQTTLNDAVDDLRQYEHGKLQLEDFKDCNWQRPLAAFGVQRAAAVGEAIRRLKIPIGKVIASPYCRCVDSANLVTNKRPVLELGIVYRRKEHTRERMETSVHKLLMETAEGSRNNFIVAHRPAMDGIGLIEEGEAFVFERTAEGRYRLIAKIKSHEWVEALVDPRLLGREGEQGYYPPHL